VVSCRDRWLQRGREGGHFVARRRRGYRLDLVDERNGCDGHWLTRRSVDRLADHGRRQLQWWRHGRHPLAECVRGNCGLVHEWDESQWLPSFVWHSREQLANSISTDTRAAGNWIGAS